MVIGASSGIGRAIAQQLAERGDRVVMVCRDPQRGDDARWLAGPASEDPTAVALVQGVRTSPSSPRIERWRSRSGRGPSRWWPRHATESLMSRSAPGETAARVLDAALELVSQGGLGALSVQAVRARSGVSVGSLYHHFGSREGILLALYERCLLALLDELSMMVGRSRTAKGLVYSMVERYLDWVEANPEVAKFLLCSAPAELDANMPPGLRQAKLERVGPMIGRAVGYAETKEIVELPPEYYELVVLGPVAETARRWLLGEPIVLARARVVLCETAWRALRAERD